MSRKAGGIDWISERPIAHRGLHDMNKECWENTLPAFERACARGYAIECDVTISADGVPVVIHDTNLVRLTGQYGWVYRHSAQSLRSMKIGRTEDRIPLLQEMLDLVAGRVPLVIELKAAPRFDGPLVEAVGRALRDYRGKAAIMSFDHRLIRRFPADAPGVVAGLTAEGLQSRELERHFSMLAYDLDFVSYNHKQLDNSFVAFMQERLSMPVICWTVRSAEEREQAARFDCQITFEGFDPGEP